MHNEFEAMKLLPKVTLKEMFTNPTLRIPLMIAMTIMIAQQLSGINAVSMSTCPHLQHPGVISTTRNFIMQLQFDCLISFLKNFALIT